jgi:hypothetical protein
VKEKLIILQRHTARPEKNTNRRITSLNDRAFFCVLNGSIESVPKYASTFLGALISVGCVEPTAIQWRYE